MIRQFDVFRNPIRSGREDRPYVVSLQHSHLDELRSRVVAPLVRERVIKPGARLTPRVTVRDEPLHFLPTELVTLSTKYLQTPIANLEEYRRQIVDALDMMFLGI
ncbi:MAG TPA: CcdB family protein [Rhizomicrobium sp.]|nr:CcdB family protein [Rhizomicrobium sp.]